ncbi:MAG: DUF4054 domain-containing protein [bacterium]|nr:DUF4054 domain-containing protein [bacterium]
MVNLTYLHQIAPEFKDFNDLVRFNILEDTANLFVDSEIFEEKTDYAIILLIAHYLALANLKGIDLFTKSVKVGELSKTFASENAENELLLTTYGAMFNRLQKSLAISPILSGA